MVGGAVARAVVFKHTINLSAIKEYARRKFHLVVTVVWPEGFTVLVQIFEGRKFRCFRG